jgi:hypothetical protein
MAVDKTDASFYTKAYAMLNTTSLSYAFFGPQRGALADDDENPAQGDMNSLGYSQEDIISILNEDDEFRILQRSLRQRGCVTNGYLKENIHFYVLHVKETRARRLIAASRQGMRGVHGASQYPKHVCNASA